jgi:hypothetical protein
MGYREALEQLLLIVIPGILLALINIFGGWSESVKTDTGNFDTGKFNSREPR